MKLHLSDCAVVRARSFQTWEEIVVAVLERRQHLANVLAERQDWFRMQQQSDLGWE